MLRYLSRHYSRSTTPWAKHWKPPEHKHFDTRLTSKQKNYHGRLRVMLGSLIHEHKTVSPIKSNPYPGKEIETMPKRRMAVLRLTIFPSVATPESVLNGMKIPFWARLVNWYARDYSTPWLELWFECTNGAHMYVCNEDMTPPMLFVDPHTGIIDWHSCDGDGNNNGSHTCPDPNNDYKE